MATAVIHMNGAPMRIAEPDLVAIEDELRRLVPPVSGSQQFRDDAHDLAERLRAIRTSRSAQERLFLGRTDRWMLLRATNAPGGAGTTALLSLRYQLEHARAA